MMHNNKENRKKFYHSSQIANPNGALGIPRDDRTPCVCLQLSPDEGVGVLDADDVGDRRDVQLCCDSWQKRPGANVTIF
jgi:hypothetical protein